MRSCAALAIHVSLAVSSLAADWTSTQNQGLDAVQRRDYKEAAVLFRQAAQSARTPVQEGRSANDLGIVLHQLTLEREARVQLDKAFGIWRANPGQEARMAQTAEALAAVDRALGNYPDAEQTLRTALLTPPADSDNRSLLFNELGDILREIGHASEARQFLEKTLCLKDLSPRRELDATIGLADLDREAHNWQASMDGWNRAIRIAHEQRWPALEAAAVRGLGVMWLERREPARAEPLLHRALALFETSDVPELQIAATLSCLAQLYLALNKFAMAEDALLRALQIAERTLGENHPQVAVYLEMLGDTVAGRKQLAQARDYYERARLIMVATFGTQSTIAAAVEASWAVVEQRANRNAEAAADYEKALAVLNAAGPEAQTLRLSVQQRYAEVRKALHLKNPVALAAFPR